MLWKILILVVVFLLILCKVSGLSRDYKAECGNIASAKGYSGEIRIYDTACQVMYEGNWIDLKSAKDLTP